MERLPYNKNSYREPKSQLVKRFVERSGVRTLASPEQIIARLIEQVRVKRHGNLLQQFIEKRKVSSVEVVTDLNCDGQIEPLGRRFEDGFKMLLKRDSSETRSRFTMAHELCHTFFYELVPEMKFGAHSPDQEEERLCNYGAAALLIHAATLRKRVADFPICIESLQELANIFSVSMPTMLIRLKSLQLWNCQFSLWHQLTNGKFALDRFYGGRPATWKWEDESILEKAYASCDSIFGRTFVSYEDVNGVRWCRPVSYQVRRFADGIMALWGSRITPRGLRSRWPLFEMSAAIN